MVLPCPVWLEYFTHDVSDFLVYLGAIRWLNLHELDLFNSPPASWLAAGFCLCNRVVVNFEWSGIDVMEEALLFVSDSFFQGKSPILSVPVMKSELK